MNTAIDPGICPICHKPNHCQNGSGYCWCFNTAPIPKGLIEQLPEEYQNTVCICADCITQYQPADDLAVSVQRQWRPKRTCR